MAGWGGFTDEELQRLKREATNGKETTTKNVKTANLTHQQKRPREKTFKSQQNRRRDVERETKPTNQVQEVSSSTDQALNDKETNEATKKEETGNQSTAPAHEVVASSGETMATPDEKDASSNTAEREEDMSNVRVLSNEEIASLELSALEELQLQQKQIEEDNKKKKKLIKDTLQARYKRAQSETHTLQTINKELSHLDELLAVDVEILRTRIEEATIAFAHAQRRYDKAEKDFVDSKLDLQMKREKKDDLTQHLYSIIKDNEERKAKKLGDLMTKLNLQNPDTVPDQAPPESPTNT